MGALLGEEALGGQEGMGVGVGVGVGVDLVRHPMLGGMEAATSSSSQQGVTVLPLPSSSSRRRTISSRSMLGSCEGLPVAAGRSCDAQLCFPAVFAM